jgi:ribosomal protein S4E
MLRYVVLSCCLLITDVVTLEKSADQFRLLYNTKGRFVLHRIKNEEATYKLCRVVKVHCSITIHILSKVLTCCS